MEVVFGLDGDWTCAVEDDLFFVDENEAAVIGLKVDYGTVFAGEKLDVLDLDLFGEEVVAKF